MWYVMRNTDVPYVSRIKTKCNKPQKFHWQLYEVGIVTGGKATFLCGGVPVVSRAMLESVCSTLRLIPTTLDSGDIWGGDFDLAILSCDGGGVERNVDWTPDMGWTSGVADRLPEAFSVRNLATKLLVEASASAWHVAWYICKDCWATELR